MPVLPNPRLREFPVLVSAWAGSEGDRDDDYGVPMSHGNDSRSRGQLIINAEGSYTVKAVLRPASIMSGYVCYSLYGWWGGFGEAWNADGETSLVEQQIALGDMGIYTLTPAITCAAVPDGDVLSMQFSRVGDNVLDTETNPIFFVGWLIEEA